jgi:hypothetical protein
MHLPELRLCPLLPFNTTTVELRDSQGNFIIDVLVQDTHDNDGERGKSKIEENDVGVIEDILAVKVGVDLVPEESKYPDDVLSSLAYSNTEEK